MLEEATITDKFRNAFPFGSGLNLFTFIKSKVGQSSAEYFYRIAVTTRITQLL